MSNLFESNSDSDTCIKTDNEYAKQYDVWRKKEELNKLKTKYGDDVEFNENSSSSSDDDEEGVELTEKIEKDFFKTLACLKNKDPRIYDKDITFFEDTDGHEIISKREKKKKDGPMYLKDYERNIILEKNGILSDEEDYVEKRPKSPTYVEEQNAIKENLKESLKALDTEEDGDEWGGLFKKRKKTKEEKEKEDADYKKWLLGQSKEIKDKDVETELKPLKDYWNNPKLDEGEKFLRDYILNKKFLDNDDDDYIPTYDEVIHDSDEDLSKDEVMIEKQEEFEHKYNFRFEEPDQEFIKRYPRTMENSVRKKDDRRKLKRQETKERKKKEKEEKMKELKKLQELKRKEIEEKLDKLKEITGNTDIGFGDEDVDGDFDPEAHDKRMQALFNDNFYQGAEGDQKPEFPDLDEELEIENWERYEHENTEGLQNAPHCEDDDFNMDCDYDPHASTQKELLDSSRSKKKRKRKSKFAEAVSKPKPKYDPNDKNYEKYFEEYYKLDCEDIIGDIPCRFKYRKVIPNDFGLTTEEILLAKERELNRWCSLKKAVQIRPDNVEKYEQIAYKKKAQNLNLKKKILPSLFLDSAEEKDNLKDEDLTNEKKNNQVEFKGIHNASTSEDNLENGKESVLITTEQTNGGKVSKKKKKRVDKGTKGIDLSQEHVENLNVSANSSEQKDDVKDAHKIENGGADKKRSKKKKKKSVTGGNQLNNGQNNVNTKRKRKLSGTDSSKVNVPTKKVKKGNSEIKELKISDARLAAYGINPKKFKNKLKYKKK